MAVACPRTLDQETQYKLLTYLDSRPDVTQRELAEHLGVSLGKVNYCLKALVGKGLVKARNFSESNNKRAYFYLLTPQGIEDKTRITISFLRRKIQEYKQLEIEIKKLELEVKKNGSAGQSDAQS
jgi:EPS-associated MarR family transcriptional regulator